MGITKREFVDGRIYRSRPSPHGDYDNMLDAKIGHESRPSPFGDYYEFCKTHRQRYIVSVPAWGLPEVVRKVDKNANRVRPRMGIAKMCVVQGF